MSARHDYYGPIHKSLRFGSAQLLIRLGATDWRDARAAAAMLAPLKLHLTLAREHLEHEDEEIHPPLRAAAGAMAAELDGDHAHHYRTFDALDALVEATEQADDASRPVAGRALYLQFSVYFSEDLAHMAREEMVALPLAQSLFSDEEMMAMETRIIAAIPPQRMVEYFNIMLPGMNPEERAGFLRYVGGNAPPEAFAQLRDVIARDCLSPRDHALLVEELAQAA